MDDFKLKLDNTNLLEGNKVHIKCSKLYPALKRCMDITVSLVGMILLLPIFMLTCIAIKVESPGPIIFKQIRSGKNSQGFNIYKFRSMKVDAPNLSTAEFEDAHDYTTKVGKFIRKTSIDELPQLFNILKGEMSIVGPRPVIESETELIKLRKLYNIDSVLPGVTGWAQINGRDHIDVEEKVKYDYEYLIKKNILFDVKIIFMTCFKVLKLEGIK